MSTARERAHAEVRAEIVNAGRRQLAETGAAGLSLRSVARDVGMVSSAVYRYFPSRDDLLTALIVEAYLSVGAAATRAESRAPRDDPAARWFALTRGTRRWALRNRHEWALIFGSPVPGYAAPQDTVDPALAIPRAMVAIASSVEAPPSDPWPMAPAVRADMELIASVLAPDFGVDRTARTVTAWTLLVGAISFELFGHLKNGVRDHARWFDHQMTVLARGLGIPA
jgi:AcrR family transcriptional regulator